MSQTKNFNELGEKPVGSLLMQYAIPAIIAMTASSLYHIIDGIFIGQGVGKEAIMGLALTGPLMSLTAAFGAMVGVGGSTLMSVKLGQKDYDTARTILGNVVTMNLVMGFSLGVVLLWLLDPILRFFGASDVTIGPARDFMTVILAGNVVTHHLEADFRCIVNHLLQSFDFAVEVGCEEVCTNCESNGFETEFRAAFLDLLGGIRFVHVSAVGIFDTVEADFLCLVDDAEIAEGSEVSAEAVGRYTCLHK